MRTLVIVLIAALSLCADERAALVQKILQTDAGSQVRVRLTNQTVVKGRLLQVEDQAISVQVASGATIAVRVLPLAQITAFDAPRPSDFGRGFRKGAGRAAGVVAVLMVLGLVAGAINH